MIEQVVARNIIIVIMQKTFLRWFGHVLRRDRGYIEERMLKVEVPGKRKGRPKRKLSRCC